MLERYISISLIRHVVNLYQELVMDHYRNPRHNGTLDAPHFHSEQRNSSCGDEVVFEGLVEKSRLLRVAFQGRGCVISQATASVLSECVIGKNCADILLLDNEDICAMLGMQLGPVRLLCAMLPLIALQRGIREYNGTSNK
jgi:nitrogen fixation protein NifU and related proteins